MRDLREAFRSLVSTPMPTLVIVVTLAVAIGANTAIFSVVSGVLLRPLGYADEDRLVVVWEENQQQGVEKSQASIGDYRDWRRQSESFDGQLALYRQRGFTMTGRDSPARIGSLQVSPRLFDVLGVPPLMGRTLLDTDEVPGNEHLAVITHASWNSRFGAAIDIVGTQVELDSESYTVVGVMPPGFSFPPGDGGVEIYSPLTIGESNPMDRPHRMYDAVGRLAPDVTLGKAQEELDAVAARIAADFPRSNEGWGVSLVPIRDELIGDIGATLWVLLAAVFAVLLIACANVANLLIARSTEASLDFMIRAALGAGRWALIRRSFADAALLAVAGGGAGLLLATWGVAMLSSVIPPSIPRGDAIGIDAPVLGFVVAASMFASVAFGLVPALRVMTPNLSDALKGGGASVMAARSRWLSGAMVVAEVSLAMALLIGAGLMVRSFNRLGETDPGFRRDGVVAFTVQLPPSRYDASMDRRAFFVELTDRVRELPGVIEVGAVSDLPMNEVGTAFEMPFTILGLDVASPTERPRADFRGVIPDNVSAMGIPLVSGRLFDRLDGEEGREVTMINDALLERYFPEGDAIGKTLQMPMAGELEIVGVVGSTRHGGLQSETGPELYVPYGQLPVSDMHLAVRSDLETVVLSRAVGDAILAIDPELVPTEIARIDDLLWESVAQPRFNTALLVGLALCAAVLAAVGIYGVVNYTVAQRTGEIGVRMAIGADARATAWMVIRQAMALVVAGLVLGVGVALLMSRFLAGMLFGVAPTDVGTYVSVTLLIIAVGFVASLVPARRATRVDPVVALRSD